MWRDVSVEFTRCTQAVFTLVTASAFSILDRNFSDDVKEWSGMLLRPTNWIVDGTNVKTAFGHDTHSEKTDQFFGSVQYDTEHQMHEQRSCSITHKSLWDLWLRRELGDRTRTIVVRWELIPTTMGASTEGLVSAQLQGTVFWNKWRTHKRTDTWGTIHKLSSL